MILSYITRKIILEYPSDISLYSLIQECPHIHLKGVAIRSVIKITQVQLKNLQTLIINNSTIARNLSQLIED
jgi:hypothetical protein